MRFTSWHSITGSNMYMTKAIWTSDLSAAVLVHPDLQPPHRRVCLRLTHLMGHGHSIEPKHFHEMLYSMTSLKDK